MPGFGFTSIKIPAANSFEILDIILYFALCYQIDLTVCHKVKEKTTSGCGVDPQ